MNPASDRLKAGRPGWRLVLSTLVLVLAVLGGLYYTAWWSLVATWMSSGTYAHGFLILPISLWLVWEKRDALIDAVPQPTLLPTLLMLPIGAVWAVGQVADAAVVQQYAFIALLILTIWAMVGTPVARFLAFPLGFLLLAVPVGEDLTYPLMNFTADFTVGLVRATGIPVYRDGTFFSLPSGDWSVVEACSGIRYLLASVTLGILYAYLTYNSLWKRLLFIGVSALVPIVANGFRAYMIVMIGHLSGMKLAVGVDHLIYGWVFFGIVIAIMFGVGSIWRDPIARVPSGVIVQGAGRGAIGVAVVTIAAASFWPGLLAVLERDPVSTGVRVELISPKPSGGWQSETRSLWAWRPRWGGSDAQFVGFYRGPEGSVGLYLDLYRTQRAGAELVTVANKLVSHHDPQWSVKEITTRSMPPEIGGFSVEQSRITGRAGELRLMVWRWYRIGDMNTSNPYLAKFYEIGYRLIGKQRPGTLVILTTPYEDSEDEAAARLENFSVQMLAPIEAEIERAVAVYP